ncbi:Transcriptional regulator, LysR family [Cupriavidus necator H850]|jgi:LysR family transcriptional regulator, transcriptional activator for dmlA|uniref:LysR family transcriptional regulator n=1 Tax=Cupriavidus TaxID=106589 RepID=UPI00129D26C2|nr:MULTISPECIES: LysR family transcriptional regulator [Cupriavidus]KAI3595766.1 Transcriptional regulator, LysR family [Cupriavidus necator H850]QUN30991.1 LysR family transcriptional regulator [Cupriavidus sp. KK10]
METQNALTANNDPFLRDLRLFCTVARRASFIAAANETGISPAHVSKRIAMLEAMLGAKLFHRTTRRVSVTAEGESAFAWAQKILEDVDGMLEAVGATGGEPRGLLRIATSVRLGRRHVAPALSRLRQQHPGLEVWLELLDRRVDLIGESFDLDIRVGEVEEPHLIASKIASGSRVLCAAPAYLARRGMPEHPGELPRHDCLLLRERDQAFGVWRLQGPDGWETVKVTGPMASNHSDVTHQWALEGFGIIMASVWDVAASVRAGELVRVLPDWQQPADVWAVTSARASASARMRVCLEFLKAQLSQGPQALATTLD